MAIYAFIFARGGSKGILNKNMQKIGGKPLVEWSIDAAKACDAIENIFVSTDDQQISSYCENLDVVVIDRPAHLASDTAAEWDAWVHAVKWVQNRYGYFDKFVSLPPTSPFKLVSDIYEAVLKLDQTGADMCVSVSESGRSPFFNMLKPTASGFYEIVMKPSEGIQRRQDSPVTYDVTTVVYASTPDYILSGTGVFGGKTTAIEIPKSRSVDIDDNFDLEMARLIYERSLAY